MCKTLYGLVSSTCGAAAAAGLQGVPGKGSPGGIVGKSAAPAVSSFIQLHLFKVSVTGLPLILSESVLRLFVRFNSDTS